jgi:hypothetical protein
MVGNKSDPITGTDRPRGFQEVEAPRFHDIRHMKVERLPAPRTDRLYPPRNIPGTHFCYRLSQPQGPSAAGRMSMKNSSDIIGNRTRYLPASATACPMVGNASQILDDKIEDDELDGACVRH